MRFENDEENNNRMDRVEKGRLSFKWQWIGSELDRLSITKFNYLKSVLSVIKLSPKLNASSSLSRILACMSHHLHVRHHSSCLVGEPWPQKRGQSALPSRP